MIESTGIVRKIDDLGRAVIPKEYRRALDINNGDDVEIFVIGNEIRVRKYAGPLCAACGQNRITHHVGHIGLCAGCAESVKAG
jgi:transcriptional pleiotropic regulator of transition state genes